MKTITFLVFCMITFPVIELYSQKTSSMNNQKNYAVEIIRYSVPEDQRNNFEKAYADAGTILQSSPYCLGYEVVRGVDEAQHYIVRIHWTSVDDHLKGFRKSKEFASFFSLVKPFYNYIEEMKHYETTSTAWNR